MSAHDRTISLEARMDAQLRNFGYGYQDEEKSGMSPPRMAVRGALAAGIGAGGYAAYKNRDAIASGAKDAARTGLKKIARGAGVVSNSLYQQSLNGNGDLLRKASSKGSGMLANVSRKLRGVAKSFSEIDALVELAERIAVLELEAGDDLREFGNTEQRSRVGVGLAGTVGTGYAGAIPAVRAQSRYSDAGHVYRKRDAAKDSIKGGLVGGTVGTGVFAGGLGGAAALGTLAAKRKLPKGMLRKAGVKSGKFVKGVIKNPAKLAGMSAAASLAATGSGLYAQGKFADKRLAKRQAQG